MDEFELDDNDLEAVVYDAQYDWIVKHCGEKAATNANYGWGADCSETMVSIATKVYGHGVLTTNATTKEDMQHEWRPF